jgi:hypothetical protein
VVKTEKANGLGFSDFDAHDDLSEPSLICANQRNPPEADESADLTFFIFFPVCVTHVHGKAAPAFKRSSAVPAEALISDL